MTRKLWIPQRVPLGKPWIIRMVKLRNKPLPWSSLTLTLLLLSERIVCKRGVSSTRFLRRLWPSPGWFGPTSKTGLLELRVVANVVTSRRVSLILPRSVGNPKVSPKEFLHRSPGNKTEVGNSLHVSFVLPR